MKILVEKQVTEKSQDGKDWQKNIVERAATSMVKMVNDLTKNGDCTYKIETMKEGVLGLDIKAFKGAVYAHVVFNFNEGPLQLGPSRFKIDRWRIKPPYATALDITDLEYALKKGIGGGIYYKLTRG